MKKLLCLLLMLCCFSVTVHANPNMKADVGEIKVAYATPVIDGDITDSEGWSGGVYAYKDLMATFGNTNDILQSFYLYYAYDDAGIYYAADIIDNSFVLSTGEDDIDNVKNDFNIKNEVVYGYNGDIFTFTIDPLGGFFDLGFYGNTDYNAWFSVGIFENDECRMYHAHNRSGDITDDVALKGKVTEGGWRFEAFIPWDIIIDDAEELSFGDVVITEDEVCADGAAHRAMAIYMDRFVDPESGDVETFQRFATCAYKLAEGTMGYLTSGVCLKSYGITLAFERADALPDDDTADTTVPDTTIHTAQTEADETPSSAPENESDTPKATTAVNNKEPDDTAAVSTKAPQTGNATGADAAQTLDIALMVAAPLLVGAGIIFIILLKKK